ncbi:MAG: HDIG domain-containing protein [Candidatus Brocadiia bacterium]|nr:HDIG domain-containing protein [Candidatus Brocadiia bacterium]
MRNGKKGRNRTGARKPPASVPAWRENLGRLLLLAVLLAGAYLVLIAGESPLPVKRGQPAPRDFRARVDFTVTDQDATQQARQLARERSTLTLKETREQFETSRSLLLTSIVAGDDQPLLDAMPDERQREMAKDVGLPILKDRRAAFSKVLRALGEPLLVGLDDWEKNAPSDPQSIVLHTKTTPREFGQGDRVFLSVESQAFRRLFGEALDGLADAQQRAVCQLLAHVLEPSAVVDVEQTRRDGDLAAEQVKPVKRTVPQHTLILAAGTKATDLHLVQLARERKGFRRSPAGRLVTGQHRIGLAIVLLALAGAGGAYIARYRTELVKNRTQTMAFGLVTLALLALTRLFYVLDVPPLLVPLPMLIMVLCLVYDQRFGFEMAALYGLLVGVVQGMAGGTFGVLLLGAMFTAFLTGRVRTRSTLIRAGALIGCVLWAATWGLGLLSAETEVLHGGRLWESELFLPSLCALGNGVMSGFLVSGLLPAIEQLFGVTTDIRLLEWSDPNQPLLQRLLVEAPGTYHHSMVVGTLAADAAEVAGANPLLARVSAYFHDVGKLKKPEYFVENLPDKAANPHDELNPTMSSLIITTHPRDGADLAEQYGVPHEVCDVILQSHGSTMIKYFWDRAKERGSEEDVPEEATYRYRLPKPGSKEAACVMFADAAEGTARSLSSPSPPKLGGLVHKIILDRLHDGQLDESGLSITDLARIEQTLTRALSAVYHSRIPYPGQEEQAEAAAPEEATAPEDAAPPAAEDAGKQEQSEEASDSSD